MATSFNTGGTFSAVTPDGAVLSGSHQGNGPPLVLISGLGGSAAFWAPVVAGLSGVGCITFDQRGIGKSSRGSAAVSIRQLAQDVFTVLDALQIKSATLLGHSTGGCIATECALLSPRRADALILSGTWIGPNKYMDRLFEARLKLLHADPGLYHGLSPYLSYPAEWLVQHPELIPDYAPEVWNVDRVAIVEERIQALLAFDRRDEVRALAQPCLLLGAKDDLVVPNVLQQEILSLMPHAHHHFFADGGHFYPLSRTAAFVEKITSWRREDP